MGWTEAIGETCAEPPEARNPTSAPPIPPHPAGAARAARAAKTPEPPSPGRRSHRRRWEPEPPVPSPPPPNLGSHSASSPGAPGPQVIAVQMLCTHSMTSMGLLTSFGTSLVLKQGGSISFRMQLSFGRAVLQEHLDAFTDLDNGKLIPLVDLDDLLDLLDLLEVGVAVEERRLQHLRDARIAEHVLDRDRVRRGGRAPVAMPPPPATNPPARAAGAAELRDLRGDSSCLAFSPLHL